MREEAEAVADLAGELGLWTVFGSIHRLSGANRPHNSRYVVSDQGELVGRYDLYTPGVAPLVFEVDGFRFGCVLCATAPAGVVAPGGRWIGRCHGDGRPGLAVAELDRAAPDADIDVAIRLARPWRRTVSASLYVVHGDPRSDTRTAF